MILRNICHYKGKNTKKKQKVLFLDLVLGRVQNNTPSGWENKNLDYQVGKITPHNQKFMLYSSEMDRAMQLRADHALIRRETQVWISALRTCKTKIKGGMKLEDLGLRRTNELFQVMGKRWCKAGGPGAPKNQRVVLSNGQEVHL